MLLAQIERLLHATRDSSDFASIACALMIRHPAVRAEVRALAKSLITTRAMEDATFDYSIDGISSRLFVLPDHLAPYAAKNASHEAALDIPARFFHRDYTPVHTPAEARALLGFPSVAAACLQENDRLRLLVAAIRDYWRVLAPFEKSSGSLVCQVAPYHDLVWLPTALYLVSDLVPEARIDFKLAFWAEVSGVLKNTVDAAHRRQAANGICHCGYMTDDMAPSAYRRAGDHFPVRFSKTEVYNSPTPIFGLLCSTDGLRRRQRNRGDALNLVGPYTAISAATASVLATTDDAIYVDTLYGGETPHDIYADECSVLLAFASGMLRRDMLVVPSYQAMAWAMHVGLVEPVDELLRRQRSFGTLRIIKLQAREDQGNVNQYVYSPMGNADAASRLNQRLADVIDEMRSFLYIGRADADGDDILARRTAAASALLRPITLAAQSMKLCLDMLPASIASELICRWGVDLGTYQPSWWSVTHKSILETHIDTETVHSPGAE